MLTAGELPLLCSALPACMYCVYNAIRISTLGLNTTTRTARIIIHTHVNHYQDKMVSVTFPLSFRVVSTLSIAKNNTQNTCVAVIFLS